MNSVLFRKSAARDAYDHDDGTGSLEDNASNINSGDPVVRQILGGQAPVDDSLDKSLQ